MKITNIKMAECLNKSIRAIEEMKRKHPKQYGYIRDGILMQELGIKSIQLQKFKELKESM